MSAILFVCTGNLCRSPMAAGLLRQRLVEEGLDTRHRVRSAGVWAVNDQPASDKAIAVMAERGIDITEHIAHTINANDMTEADLILVMTRDHEQILRNTWPQYGWKVRLLSQMIGKTKDVQDPYGGTVQEYRACADILADYIDRGFQHILELA
jgi:protein-tyrosine-phosphatase